MNRSKLPLSAKVKKKITKEVHAAQMGKPTALPREKPSLKEELKKYPKKRPELVASVKRMEIQKKKRTAKRSKRTTPGEVFEQPSAPQNVHREGKRWIQTLERQNAVGAKIFQKKGLKKGLSKRK